MRHLVNSPRLSIPLFLSRPAAIGVVFFPSSCDRIEGSLRRRVFPRNMSAAPAEAANARPSPPLAGGAAEGEGKSHAGVVVQYVVLRRDLIDSWPLGSVVTQGCHAAVASIWAHREHPDTVSYCSDANLDFMHKVTLEVKGEAQILNLSEKLAAAGIAHKLWIEQPENIPTCIATRPYPKAEVAPFFKKLKLCK